MARHCVSLLFVAAVSLAILYAAAPSFAQDLTTRDCSELVRMAQTLQEDLKTVDTVLESAIDAGNMDRIRSYKLRKSEIKKKLTALLRVIDLKECGMPK